MPIKARLTADEYNALTSADLKGHYKQTDPQTYVLDVPDAEDVFAQALKRALQSERDEQKKLGQANAALRADLDKFKDIDPEEFKRLKTAEEALHDKKLVDAGKVDELVAKRLETRDRDWDAKLKASQAETARALETNTTLRAKLETALIGSNIRAVAATKGVREEAVPDVMNRAASVWKLSDDLQPVPYRDGQIYYGKKATEPISMDEWMDALATDAPHLFHPNSGGGARPGSSGSRVNGSAIRLTRDQARDPRTYQQAKEQAEKQGLELQIAEG